MEQTFFWDIIGRVSSILSIVSCLVSFALWLNFGKLKKEIERENIKYIEEQEKILKNFNSIYRTLFVDNERTDDIISRLRKQIYFVNKHFKKLMVKEDFRYIMILMKLLRKDTDKIDFPEIRKNLDCIITTFTEKFYEHQ